MAEFDYDDIKFRMKLILQGDTSSLYNATGEGNKTKLVEIEVGFPNDDTLMGRKFPFAFITMFGQIDSITLEGSTVSDNIKHLSHTMRITVAIGVNEADSKAAELRLDDFTKIIMDNFETDPQLKNGGSPLVSQIVPERVAEWENNKMKHGTNVQGRFITFKVTKESGQP